MLCLRRHFLLDSTFYYCCPITLLQSLFYRKSSLNTMAKHPKRSTTPAPSFPCREVVKDCLQKDAVLFEVLSCPIRIAKCFVLASTDKALVLQENLPSHQPSQSAGQGNPSIDLALSTNTAPSRKHRSASSPDDHCQSGRQALTPMERWIRESTEEGPWNSIMCHSPHPLSGDIDNQVDKT